MTLATAEAQRAALVLERDGLERDLAAARETIEATRKRAELAERERDEARTGYIGCCPRHVWGDGEHDLNCQVAELERDLAVAVARAERADKKRAELEKERDKERKLREQFEDLCSECQADRKEENLRGRLAASEARCAEIEKQRQLAATDAFKVGQAYQEQSRRMRAAEARITELEQTHAAETVGCCARYIWGDGVHNLDCLVPRLAVSEARCKALEGALRWAMTHVENVFALSGRHDRERPQLEAARAALAQQTADAEPTERSCAHSGCLEAPTAEVTSFYCGKHNPFPPHPDHPFGPVHTINSTWQLNAVGPAREAPSACTNCGHEEIHHNSPVANGRCEGEFERCGCSKFAPPSPASQDPERDECEVCGYPQRFHAGGCGRLFKHAYRAAAPAPSTDGEGVEK